MAVVVVVSSSSNNSNSVRSKRAVHRSTIRCPTGVQSVFRLGSQGNGPTAWWRPLPQCHFTDNSLRRLWWGTPSSSSSTRIGRSSRTWNWGWRRRRRITRNNEWRMDCDSWPLRCATWTRRIQWLDCRRPVRVCWCSAGCVWSKVVHRISGWGTRRRPPRTVNNVIKRIIIGCASQCTLRLGRRGEFII